MASAGIRSWRSLSTTPPRESSLGGTPGSAKESARFEEGDVHESIPFRSKLSYVALHEASGFWDSARAWASGFRFVGAELQHLVGLSEPFCKPPSRPSTLSCVPVVLGLQVSRAFRIQWYLSPRARCVI